MATHPSVVVPFDEADYNEVDKFGGKGAGLARMRFLGLPVPPGFVITTEVCLQYLDGGVIADDVWGEIVRQMNVVEGETGRVFGDPLRPLLVSVRSGAPVSMPGMMDTILNIGICDLNLEALSNEIGVSEAHETYIRLLSQFGVNVFGLSPKHFELQDEIPDSAEVESLAKRRLEGCRQVFVAQKLNFPQEPYIQLRLATEAVFRSWLAPRAERYRKHAGISAVLGTAVVVQAMVFGNLDESSGTGVAFTRDPATGFRGIYGDFLRRAQGEDVVAGEIDPDDIDLCRLVAPDAYDDLAKYAAMLEVAYRDMCDIEFTVEQGRLWILQVRRGQRTGLASVRIALDLVHEGIIDMDKAIEMINPAALQAVREPVFSPDEHGELLGTGLPASPGAAVGHAAFDSSQAEKLSALGKRVILIRAQTSPEDIAGFIAADGIVTAHGGRTSHAAVVARGLNKPAVCGVEDLVIEAERGFFPGGNIEVGDVLSVDGSRGLIFSGSIPFVEPQIDPRIEFLLKVCDEKRQVPVLAMRAGLEWADGEFDDRKFMTCDDEDSIIEAQDDSEVEYILLNPASSSGEFEFRELIDRALETGKELALFVDRKWPRTLALAPSAPWKVIAAGEGGDWIARLLACSAKHTNEL